MTEITLYNTKTRRKERFQPLDPENVRMYVCGPTVYDRAHIGNARPVIVFDVLYRLLRHVYGPDHVTYARNFTDVDDKINARAAETGRSIREITDETIRWYLDDMGALGNLEPDLAPRATEYIAEMVAMIDELIASGHAYEAEGHVLFDVTSYEKYGSLSGRSIDDMIAGARVEVAPYKRNPMDFVLWKPSGPDLPGWDSPWGRGRPGWHIECSAMTRALFGERFDIHGGGLDLAFPHHENEKAQSCCEAGEESFAQVWMHNEMLQVEGKKMSKSLGNFFSVREVLDGTAPILAEQFDGSEMRMAYLLSHYRSTMDFGVKRRHEAKTKIRKWAEFLGRAASEELPNLTPSRPFPEVVEAIADDLSTRKAIDFLEPQNLKANLGPDWRIHAREIYASQLFLGFDLKENVFTIQASNSSSEILNAIVGSEALYKVAAKIEAARSVRDFQEADRLKAAVVAAGYEVQISADGATIKVTPISDYSKLEALL